MIREDGTSTIEPILNAEDKHIGVKDTESAMRVVFEDAEQKLVRVETSDSIFLVPTKDLGTLRDLFGRMMEVCAMPATN